MNRANRKPARVPRRETTSPLNKRKRRLLLVEIVIPAGIFLLTAIAFLPTLNNDFVNWDDFDTLVTNSRYQGLGLAQLRWMFTTFFLGHYQPLTWVTWSLDFLLWGKDPFGFHLTNLLTHGVNAVLFYFVCRRLLLLAFGKFADQQQVNMALATAFAALLFAVHPLRVESVAWVTERRDVLSASMLFCTLLCYLRATRAQGQQAARRAWLSPALGFYLISLLSKATGITLAVVLIILDWYPLRRLSADPRDWLNLSARKVFIEKIPFLLLGIIFAVIAIFAQEQAGAMSLLENYPIPRRLAQALYGASFYVWKTLLPVGLSPFYQLYPKPNVFSPFDFRFIISAIVVLSITAGAFALRKRWPALLAAWACYIVVVSPVLGLAQSGPQFVADRYSYLSCVSWALLAGAGLFIALRRSSSLPDAQEKVLVTSGLAGLLLLVLGVLTWNQTYVWRNSESLWRRAVAVNPRSTRAQVYLGTILKSQNKFQEATDHYEQALRIDPDYTDAHYNLALALAGLNRLDSAIDHLRQYMEKTPNSTISHVEMGNFLGRQGKVDEQIREYQEALKIDRRSADAHFGLGNALAIRGDLEEAKKHLRRAVELSPQTGDFYLSLGNLLVKQDRLSEAIETFREAVKNSPELSPARNNLGRLLAAQGDLPAAIEVFREALRIDPTFAPLHESLAQALEQIGKKDEAMEHYREAVRLMQMGAPAGARP
jgi:tetratricopeptide (TPR) repeat protein